MLSFALLPLLAGLGYGLPQAANDNCETTTTEVIIPTATNTWTATEVSTVTASTARDLGTHTSIVQLSSTKTLQTLTETSTLCTASGTITNAPASTVYTTSGASAPAPDAYDSSSPAALAAYTKRSPLEITARQDACTVTETFTTTYGNTYTFFTVPGVTSTYTRYTDFSQATVTSTSSGGTDYAIATATATTEAVCGPTANSTAPGTSTVTRDARCAPSAIISEQNGFGLDYSSSTPAGGATFVTNATDASACCQLCADAYKCGASSWDIRNHECKLEFPIGYDTGELNCGYSLLTYYIYGPAHPMEPGSGMYIAELCGNTIIAAGRPDDGT